MCITNDTIFDMTNIISSSWYNLYETTILYCKGVGNGQIPAVNHVYDSKKIGVWIWDQYVNYNDLDKDKKKKIDYIFTTYKQRRYNFADGDKNVEYWNANYDSVYRFFKKKRHLNYKHKSRHMEHRDWLIRQVNSLQYNVLFDPEAERRFHKIKVLAMVFMLDLPNLLI